MFYKTQIGLCGFSVSWFRGPSFTGHQSWEWTHHWLTALGFISLSHCPFNLYLILIDWLTEFTSVSALRPVACWELPNCYSAVTAPSSAQLLGLQGQAVKQVPEGQPQKPGHRIHVKAACQETLALWNAAEEGTQHGTCQWDWGRAGVYKWCPPAGARHRQQEDGAASFCP